MQNPAMCAFLTPFNKKPWRSKYGAASSTAGQSRALKGISAGGLSGDNEISLTFPMEFIKTQLQLNDKGKYKGFVDCIKKTIKERGIFGIYRGLSILFYGSVSKSAIRFGAFEFVKSRLIDADGYLTSYSKAFAGTGAGMLEALIITTPMETIKVKFINDQRSAEPNFKGLLHGIRTIVRSDGLGGIYQAVGPTLLKESSNQAVRFFIMETAKEWYQQGDKKKPIPKLVVGCFGALSGTVSVFVNAPLDIVKTRMQSLEAAKYKNSLDCAAQVWKNDGLIGFFKGNRTRTSRVFIEVAIAFMIYDTFMDIFNQRWP